MGHDPNREAPFFFQKNAQNIDISGTFPYPPQTSDVHHEIELVVALQSGGADISEDDAMQHVYGYAVALDMTRRDLQGEAKKTGRPWEIGKAFERSAPMSALVPASETGHLDAGRISLKINDDIRQDGDLNQMIWKVPEMISYLSRFYDIAAGDLIMSGTPAGVGPVAKGDILTGEIEGLGTLVTHVV
jgi:fumarylpyruvate hydrolase